MRKQVIGYVGILLMLVLALTTINCQSSAATTAAPKQCPLAAMGVPCSDDQPGKVCPIAQGKDPCGDCISKAKVLQAKNEADLETQFARHMEAKEYDKALDVISRIDKTLPANPKFGYNPQVVNTTAYIYMVKGDYNKALENYNQLLKSFPEDAGSLYNVTCIYSLKGSKQAACEYLGKAVQYGYNDWKHMDKDTDLDNIRNENEYKKLRGELENRFPKGAMASPCQGCPSAQKAVDSKGCTDGCKSTETAKPDGCKDCQDNPGHKHAEGDPCKGNCKDKK
jgi:hypothetical protein